MTAPESITEAELTRALIHHQHSGDKPCCDSCRNKAASILEYIAAHREPEYEPGEAYADARGDKYLRSSSGGWVDYSTTWHPHELPKRPLRKLVPEGSQSAKPSHFDVLAEIVTGLGRDETDKQLASRICKLMGVSDEH